MPKQKFILPAKENILNFFCNACNPTFYWSVRCTPCSCWVCPCMGHTRQKSLLFKLIVKFFLKGVVFMFWHDIVYIELLYCVTHFQLIWNWNKIVVVENAKKCRQNSTFPFYSKQINVITGAPVERRARGNCPRCPPFNPALYVTFYQINKLSANIWFFHYSWNGFTCRMKWFLGSDYKYRITKRSLTALDLSSINWSLGSVLGVSFYQLGKWFVHIFVSHSKRLLWRRTVIF